MKMWEEGRTGGFRLSRAAFKETFLETLQTQDMNRTDGFQHHLLSVSFC